jgi:hypothetical protein
MGGRCALSVKCTRMGSDHKPRKCSRLPFKCSVEGCNIGAMCSAACVALHIQSHPHYRPGVVLVAFQSPPAQDVFPIGSDDDMLRGLQMLDDWCTRSSLRVGTSRGVVTSTRLRSTDCVSPYITSFVQLRRFESPYWAHLVGLQRVPTPVIFAVQGP